MNLKERAKQLKRDLPAIFIALKDPQTPIIAKIPAVITVTYALSPIDLIPDFIPVLGYLDDLLLLPLMIYVTLQLIPREVWIRSQEASVNLWKDGKPKKWYYAIPIVMIYLIIIYVIIVHLR